MNVYHQGITSKLLFHYMQTCSYGTLIMHMYVDEFGDYNSNSFVNSHCSYIPKPNSVYH